MYLIHILRDDNVVYLVYNQSRYVNSINFDANSTIFCQISISFQVAWCLFISKRSCENERNKITAEANWFFVDFSNVRHISTLEKPTKNQFASAVISKNAFLLEQRALCLGTSRKCKLKIL